MMEKVIQDLEKRLKDSEDRLEQVKKEEEDEVEEAREERKMKGTFSNIVAAPSKVAALRYQLEERRNEVSNLKLENKALQDEVFP